MLPDDARIGRLLAGGRFEITAWIGNSKWMGVMLARDVGSSQIMRVTVAGKPAIPVDAVRDRLGRDVPGLARVAYVGPVDSDDGWGRDCVAFVEELPPGQPVADT